MKSLQPIHVSQGSQLSQSQILLQPSCKVSPFGSLEITIARNPVSSSQPREVVAAESGLARLSSLAIARPTRLSQGLLQPSRLLRGKICLCNPVDSLLLFSSTSRNLNCLFFSFFQVGSPSYLYSSPSRSIPLYYFLSSVFFFLVSSRFFFLISSSFPSRLFFVFSFAFLSFLFLFFIFYFLCSSKNGKLRQLPARARRVLMMKI